MLPSHYDYVKDNQCNIFNQDNSHKSENHSNQSKRCSLFELKAHTYTNYYGFPTSQKRRVYGLLTLASSTEPEERSINSLRMTLCLIYIHSGRRPFSVCVCVCVCARPCASGSLAFVFRRTEGEQTENPMDGEGFLWYTRRPLCL